LRNSLGSLAIFAAIRGPSKTKANRFVTQGTGLNCESNYAAFLPDAEGINMPPSWIGFVVLASMIALFVLEII
jgi:hypothetical protein